MIVLDASVVVELLINGPLAESIGQEIVRHGEPLMAPHLIDVEVVSAIRSLDTARRIDSHDVKQCLARLAELPAERVPHTPFLARVWELRHNFTAYDATYIAIAEATGAVLYTSDAKLAKGHRARVRVFGE